MSGDMANLAKEEARAALEPAAIAKVRPNIGILTEKRRKKSEELG